LRDASEGEVTAIGLVLAKSVFQTHGADASGGVVLRKNATRSGAVVLRSAAGALGGDRGLRQRPLLDGDLEGQQPAATGREGQGKGADP